MNRHTAVLLAAIVAGQPRAAQPAETTLDSLKQTYEVEVQKIRDEHDTKLRELLDAYGRSLDKAVEILKKKGDPDSVLQAIAETRRFEQESTVPAEASSKLPNLLQDVRTGYHDAAKKAEVAKAKRFIDLTERYDATLEKLMGALTAQEKLDLALNVKAERKRVAFVCADVESKLKALLKIPGDAVRVRWHFYRAFAGSSSWSDAKRRCEDMGGHLVTITSSEENVLLTEEVTGDVARAWIGARRESKEDWRWVTGEPFLFQVWGPGHPGKKGDYLSTHGGKAGTWSGKWAVRPHQYSLVESYICVWEI